MSDFKELLTKETAGLPNWAWVAVVVAGVGATYFLPKLLGKSTNTTANTPTTSTDAGTSASGIGLAVDPTTGLPYAVEGLVPSGANAGSSTVGTSASQPLMSEVGLIRSRDNSSLTASYDKKTAGGVPIRAAANTSSTVGLEQYGTQVQVTGPAVTGGYNLPGNKGSNLWFPVSYGSGQHGYVSAYDFNGAPVERTGQWPSA